MIPILGTIDLSDVTTQVTALSTSLVGAATLVIGGGLSVAAVYWGGKVLWRAFKGFAR